MVNCDVQESFNARGRRYSPFVSFLFYSRLYNYVLAVANICHYRAIQACTCFLAYLRYVSYISCCRKKAVSSNLERVWYVLQIGGCRD